MTGRPPALTPEEAADIRQFYADRRAGWTVTVTALARSFRVSTATIQNVLNRKGVYRGEGRAKPTKPKGNPKMRNRPALRSVARDERIERLFYQRCRNIQIDIMDIGKVFKVGLAGIERGETDEQLGDTIAAFVETIRRN